MHERWAADLLFGTVFIAATVKAMFSGEKNDVFQQSQLYYSYWCEQRKQADSLEENSSERSICCQDEEVVSAAAMPRMLRLIRAVTADLHMVELHPHLMRQSQEMAAKLYAI